MAPLGILGGTFNPIHYAHLRLAEELTDSLGLGEVRIIPAATPPHRPTPQVNADHRLAMVRAAVAGNARLVLDDRECRRTGLSFTVDTLLELRHELGPERPFFLLMGVDAFHGLPSWSRWEQLFDLAHVVVVHRPGFTTTLSPFTDVVARQLETRRRDAVSDLQPQAAGFILFSPITPLDISATAIRAALADGRSPRYLLPDSVLDYIHRHHLYKDLDAV